MKNKVILTDCDGVILDWEYSFKKWMTRHGYVVVKDDCYDIAEAFGLEKKLAKMLVRMFNESAWIRKLPPLRDAIKYMKMLHEDHGFVFHAITSLSNDYYAQHLRTKNLIELFGLTVFEQYVYLDTGEDKDEELVKYKDSGCYWVEDKPENALCGLKFGLKPLLVSHDFNDDFNDASVTKVKNWKEIYELIV